MPLPWASLVAVLTRHYRYMHLVSVHTAGSGQLEPSQSCA